MPFTPDEFALRRPYLFHLTDRGNLRFLKHMPRLLPAGTLLEKAGRADWIRRKRDHHVDVVVDGISMRIRDQAPLHKGNMQLGDGWSFEDFVARLNGRVFFWPGTAVGAVIANGARHFARYAHEAPVVLRAKTADLFARNDVPPEFCRYNSGSPRWTRGSASPRGETTFVGGADAPYGVPQVVEVTFPAAVELPNTIEVADSPAGPWTSLRERS